ncbi:MAG: YciI family protein [Anaerolineaceae bacterium]|nr:YciI family protein [Anaerolineaceae bacterium]
MKHFIIEINYLVPAEQLGDITNQHRVFLQGGYDQGWLLCSGPRVPRTGGIVVGRAPALEDLQDFFKQDPYQVNGLATYNFIEFQPVKYNPFLEGWVSA